MGSARVGGPCGLSGRDDGYLIEVPSQREAVAAVHGSLAGLPRGRWLLAVSGGKDSMALLDAFASARSGEVCAVATFDHGTGPAARRAAALVVREAERRALPVVSGAMLSPLAPTEATWREARWRFLGGWAREHRAVVVTAHTRDDQVETVVQRILRGAGARGLAGMAVRGTGPGGVPVLRPFLGLPRATVHAYVRARRLRTLEDPSNAGRAHQRNRVRLDLLPALERAQPGFGAWCVDLAERAASWRATVERCVDALGVTAPEPGLAVVPAAAVAGYAPPEWKVLWPAVAARAGVALDWRGVARASAWAPRAAAGSRIPLAGRATIERTVSSFVVRRG